MYYPPNDDPWYWDYNIWFIVAIAVVLIYGYLTGQVHPECFHQVCK
jgi:hypothetical protein